MGVIWGESEGGELYGSVLMVRGAGYGDVGFGRGAREVCLDDAEAKQDLLDDSKAK